MMDPIPSGRIQISPDLPGTWKGLQPRCSAKKIGPRSRSKVRTTATLMILYPRQSVVEAIAEGSWNDMLGILTRRASLRASEHASWFHDSCRKQRRTNSYQNVSTCEIQKGEAANLNVWFVSLFSLSEGPFAVRCLDAGSFALLQGLEPTYHMWSSYLRRWKEKQLL